MSVERIQKILAQAGYGSRRSCEGLISSERVEVNGKIPKLGDKADPFKDHIKVDGKSIEIRDQLIYIALYKPRGVLSSVRSQDNRTVVNDLIPQGNQLYPVGRLDYDSEGLVLMTNDGNLANQLTHPRYKHEKEYQVLVAKNPDPLQLDLWRKGIVLSDGFHTAPAKVDIVSKVGKGIWLKVTLIEGHKRQIREMGKVTGLPVVRIIRVRIGGLSIGNLKPGEWRYLNKQDIPKILRKIGNT